jgi:ligand-binding sensor domain-containing protein/CheY-like chemotaxis protein/nitrogen-specific signal transduction histidine kinase/AraC-like DNA-binding protein
MNRHFKFNLFFFIFILLFQQAIVAKDYKITQFSSNEGLSQQDVECIVQDKQGFVWIGTYDGLNRYDGNNFVLFRHIPNDSSSISDNRIICLKEWAERNELWIGTDGGGLNCFDQKTQKFTCFLENKRDKQSLFDNQISCIDKENNSLWVGTSKGVNRLSFDAKNRISIERFSLKVLTGEHISQYINAISHDLNGNIIVGTVNGLYCKQKNGVEFEFVKGLSETVKRIINDKSGNLWVITNAGINYYSPSQQKLNNYLSNPRTVNFNLENTKDIQSILPITDQLYMLATSNQVYWMTLKDNDFIFSKSTFSENTFFDNNKMKALMLDRSMNIWITSGLDGVARFDLNSKSIYHYPLKHAQVIDKLFIQALTKDSKGRLWIGSSKGVFIEDFKKNNTIRIESINDGIFDIIEDKKQNIWITSLRDIHFLPAGNEKKVISIMNLPNLPKEVSPLDGPYALCADSRNIIWVGMRSGLLQIKKENNSFSNKLIEIKLFKSLRTSNNITKILFEQQDNSLLIGTKNAGLLKAYLTVNGDVKGIQPISKPQNGKLEHIWSIFKASNGTIYVGTDSGLKKLILKNGKETLELIDSDIRLQTYKIAAMVGDNNHNLWLSTSMGLLCYNIENQSVKQYFITDGLSTNILTEGSFFDSKGYLFIGSIKGLNIIDLSSLTANNILPQTQFSSLKINNVPIQPLKKINGRILLKNSLEYTENLKLKYYENNFSIEFASLHFSNPAKNMYSYRLVGFSNDWTEVNNSIRSATFTNVPPGKYTLEVKSSNCDGVWNEAPKSMIIQINPAPWDTFWAYLIYFMIVASIIYFILKYYFDRQKLKKELLEEHFQHSKDLEIAEVKLKYHTNITHELRTPLSLISAPTEELIAKSYNDDFLNSRLQIIKSNADRLLQLIGQFLDFRKVINEKYTLSIAKDNLNELLLNIKDNFMPSAKLKHINLELFYDLNEKNYWFDKEMVNKICYNLLSNAIKHTPIKGKISIYATQGSDETRALISVEDNGVGIAENEIGKIFERFYQVPGSVGGTGIGLNLCKHLANLHLGDITVKSRVGEGTIFTLEIPINKEAYNEDVISEKPLEVENKKSEILQEIDEEIDTKPVILVIEDNFELRDYIHNLLSEVYNVFLAENGAEGLKIAIEQIPDIIISDIMMPVMDGIEFTEKCKNTINTSHIPVILLTAKASEESQIEGLTYGADDYITKPFNPQILKLKVNNLIKLTKKRKKEVSQNMEKLNDREQKFMNTFEQIVLENYSTPDFGIDKICSMMAMSRMQLYRKMMAIVNKKPSQLIKELKMKKAYQLMKEKGMNITETMYELEYTNYTHFTRQFTEVNGISPRKVLGMKD